MMAPMAATALLASPTGAAPPTRRFDAAARLRSLEVGAARLGVCFFDTATGEVSGYRLEEHFAMCSTFDWRWSQHACASQTGAVWILHRSCPIQKRTSCPGRR